MLETWRQVFLLLNDELRRLYKKDFYDLEEDGDLAPLRDLMDLFGLEHCAVGLDSWDTFEMLGEDLGEDLQMDYEDYLVSDLDPMAAFED